MRTDFFPFIWQDIKFKLYYDDETRICTLAKPIQLTDIQLKVTEYFGSMKDLYFQSNGKVSVAVHCHQQIPCPKYGIKAKGFWWQPITTRQSSSLLCNCHLRPSPLKVHSGLNSHSSLHVLKVQIYHCSSKLSTIFTILSYVSDHMKNHFHQWYSQLLSLKKMAFNTVSHLFVWQLKSTLKVILENFYQWLKIVLFERIETL